MHENYLLKLENHYFTEYQRDQIAGYLLQIVDCVVEKAVIYEKTDDQIDKKIELTYTEKVEAWRILLKQCKAINNPASLADYEEMVITIGIKLLSAETNHCFTESQTDKISGYISQIANCVDEKNRRFFG